MAVHYEFRGEASDITMVVLTGQLNLGNRLMELEHQIKQHIEEGARKMVLDMTGLTYIDSAGLGTVATCAGIISKAGGKLVVVTAGGKIAQMFQLTRMDHLIGVYSDSSTACAALTQFSAKASGT